MHIQRLDQTATAYQQSLEFHHSELNELQNRTGSQQFVVALTKWSQCLVAQEQYITLLEVAEKMRNSSSNPLTLAQ